MAKSKDRTLKNDIYFKAFFSRNPEYLQSFLKVVLGKDIKIKKVIHDSRLEQLSEDMKYGVLDIEAELSNGEII